MKLGFINFSTEEQLKMHQVMQAIQEHKQLTNLDWGAFAMPFPTSCFLESLLYIIEQNTMPYSLLFFWKQRKEHTKVQTK